jgi:gamma-glutamylcyclotransferase (GGCT)/AIG2-like uncharacterized protein YtfP
MPHYFAYGANMDREAMRLRCPRSRMLGRARLARRRFFVMSDGFASVTPEPRGVVHGVLWDLALADVRALDVFEGVARGWYEKRYLPVLREPFGSVTALVYVGRTANEGAPARDYFAGVLAAARAAELPAAYVAHLETFARADRRNET